MEKLHWLDKLEKEGREALKYLKRKTDLDSWGKDTQTRHQFFYELIANADDENATKVKLTLDKNKMIFQHNGKPFTKEDVENITSYKKRKKEDKLDKIGNFGSGFKTIHQFCDEPKIYTQIDKELIAFKIEEKIIPCKIKLTKGEDKDLNNQFNKYGQTKFIFDFNNKKKSEKQFLDIKSFKKFLNENNEEFLLFLPNIKEIIFNIDNTSFKFKKNINKIDENLFKVSLLNQNKSKKFFYIYSKKFSLPGYEANNKASLSVAYKCNEKWKKFSQVNNDKNLFVTFRTQESFEYKFCINAPFRTTESRISVQQENIDNQNLSKLCEEVVLNSILKLKEYKLLNISFFDLLPLDKDNINNRFENIKNKILFILREEAIWPVDKLSEFLTIDKIIFGEPEYKKNFNNDDLKSFDINEKWLYGHLSIRTKELLNHLNVEQFDSEKINSLYNNWTKILENKNEKKLFSIYNLLQSKLDESDLNYLPVVKSEDGNFCKGNELRFPTKIQNQQSDIKFIFKKFLKNNKTEEIKKLFFKFGVKEIDFEDIINISYKKNNFNFDSKIGIDIEKYEKFLQKLIDSKIHINPDLHPYLIDENNICRKSYELYIDDKSHSTRLNDIYENFSKIDIKKYKVYFPKKIDTHVYLDFLNKLNVQKELKVKEQNFIQNRNITRKFYSLYDPPTGRSKSEETDYWIDGLEIIINNNMTLKKSFFIRDALNEGIENYYDISKSTYKRTKNSLTRSEESSLIFFLKKMKWIPDTKGNFKMAQDLNEDTINKKFYQNINLQCLEWLNFNLKDNTKNDEKKIVKKYFQDADWAMEHPEEADKAISEAKAKFESESKEMPKSKKFGKLHRKVLDDDMPMEDNFDDKNFIKKRSFNKNVHQKNYNVEKQSVRSKYQYHCQMCYLEDYKHNSYSEHTENRRKMTEDAHIVKDSVGGPAKYGNLLSLCVYHHHFYGNQLTPNIVLDSFNDSGLKWEGGIIHKIKFLDGNSIDIYFKENHKILIIKYLREYENKKVVNLHPNKNN